MTNTTTWDAMEGLFKIAQRTPLNIAPERGAELTSRVIGADTWVIKRSDQPAQFFAIPADKAIYLTGAGQASLWCLSYVAFHVMDFASRLQRAVDYDKDACMDIGQYFAALHLGEYIAFARSLVHADLPWPSNLKTPANAPSEDSLEWRINNVYLGALSWILLHEIGHVHHGDQKFVPSSVALRQEHGADAFATEWILDNAGQGLQREFRLLMTAVALTWLFMCELEKKGLGTTHPRTILRFREVVAHFEAGERSAGYENATYLFKAVLDPTTVPPAHRTPREAFEWMSVRLEELFSA